MHSYLWLLVTFSRGPLRALMKKTAEDGPLFKLGPKTQKKAVRGHIFGGFFGPLLLGRFLVSFFDRGRL